jgi:hypothetical protein
MPTRRHENRMAEKFVFPVSVLQWWSEAGGRTTTNGSCGTEAKLVSNIEAEMLAFMTGAHTDEVPV